VPIRFIDGGEHVVAIFEARAYGKHSDVEVNLTGAHLWTLREGRIIAWHVYFDPAEALEAVGLSE
jgi:ketosteroid isomerase-like protein